MNRVVSVHVRFDGGGWSATVGRAAGGCCFGDENGQQQRVLLRSVYIAVPFGTTVQYRIYVPRVIKFEQVKFLLLYNHCKV